MNKRKMRKTELVGLELIQDSIELVLWTSYLKGEKPASLILLAEPESGKTELMKKYRENVGVYVRRRFSACGILEDLIAGSIHMLFERPRILGHIVIYDLTSLFSFKHNTVDATIEFLSALTEEGLSEESYYWMRGNELKKFINLRGGIIAGVNKFGFFTADGGVKANMHKGGWFSRNIVISYGLSGTLVSRIYDSISNGRYRYDKDFVNKISLELPRKRTKVYMTKQLAEEIADLAREVAEGCSEGLKSHDLRGFRLQKSLISLTKASALRDGRTEVNSEDIERIRYLSRWMNLRMNHLETNYPHPW